jgi:hypothetical protein
MITENTKPQAPPKSARFQLVVNVDTENWDMLKHLYHYTDEKLAGHLTSDIECALSQYEGYHNLISKDEPVESITLEKYY